MQTDIFTAVLLTIHMYIYRTAAIELYAEEGDSVTFELPSVARCGNYQFLNPQLSPLIIIKNQSAAAVQAAYIKRTSVYVVDNSKLRLTLDSVAPIDRGKYRVYTKTGDVRACSKIHNYLNVKARDVESLTIWSAWSDCSPLCDPSAQRTRERNCSVPEGCKGLGHMFEIDSCLLDSVCPVWSQWSNWSSCSRICGRGQRTRNRTCSSTNNTYHMANVSCIGNATQEEICESKPCRGNATFWTPWGSWGPCNLTCGGGYRQRTREALFPGSQVVASFAGWSAEEEQCNTHKCEEKAVTGSVEVPESRPNVTWIIACACAVFIIILLIVILLLIIRLRKKKIGVMSLVRSFRQSRQKNKNKSIATPEIPRKASEPNAYHGVKVATPENARNSQLLSKDNKRKKITTEVASTLTLTVDNLSYSKRPKSGKTKTKKKSSEGCKGSIRISAPIQESNPTDPPIEQAVYDTPRNSIGSQVNGIEVAMVDSDDTYEIPHNPDWDESHSYKYTETPEIVVTDDSSITNVAKLLLAHNSFKGSSDIYNSSQHSSEYASKCPSSIGLSDLYDTPRSSTSNLAELIYDVPRHKEPLYENENFHISDEEFYVTPKTSVSSM